MSEAQQYKIPEQQPVYSDEADIALRMSDLPPSSVAEALHEARSAAVSREAPRRQEISAQCARYILGVATLLVAERERVRHESQER